MAVFRLADTLDYPATNELAVDMWGKTWESFPSIVPLTAIMSKMSDENSFNFRVDLIERHAMPISFTLNNNASTGTSLTINTDYNALVEGTLLFNARTEDIASVDTTPTTATVTVSRSAAGTTAVAWLADDVLFAMLNVIAENEADYIESASKQNTNVYNYQQLNRLCFAVTRTDARMKTVHGGTFREMAQTQKWREYLEKKEINTYMGGRSTSGTAPATIRTMGGLHYFLKDGDLFKDFGGNLTETSFDDYLNSIYVAQPDIVNPWCFLAPGAKKKIYNFAKAKGQITLDEETSNTYGMQIDEYDYDGMMVKLVRLPLLAKSPDTNGWGWLLDLDRMTYKTLEKEMLHKDIVGMRSEVITDMYRGQSSMLLANQEKHSMFVNA